MSNFTNVFAAMQEAQEALRELPALRNQIQVGEAVTAQLVDETNFLRHEIETLRAQLAAEQDAAEVVRAECDELRFQLLVAEDDLENSDAKISNIAALLGLSLEPKIKYETNVPPKDDISDCQSEPEFPDTTPSYVSGWNTSTAAPESNVPTPSEDRDNNGNVLATPKPTPAIWPSSQEPNPIEPNVWDNTPSGYPYA